MLREFKLIQLRQTTRSSHPTVVSAIFMAKIAEPEPQNPMTMEVAILGVLPTQTLLSTNSLIMKVNELQKVSFFCVKFKCYKCLSFSA
jgi:hypothetical protein